jgi:VanZ family protein
MLLWLPVIVYMAIIFAASSIPYSPVPSDRSSGPPHAALYFGLTALLVRALANGRWSGVTAGTLVTAWIIAVTYGVTDEWHQSFVPNRFSDVGDVVANAIGAAAAGIAIGAWGIIRRL